MLENHNKAQFKPDETLNNLDNLNSRPLHYSVFFVCVRVTYQQRALHLIKLGSVGKTHEKAIAASILILNTAEA